MDHISDYKNLVEFIWMVATLVLVAGVWFTYTDVIKPHQHAKAAKRNKERKNEAIDQMFIETIRKETSAYS